jgi:hypothetical protein
LRSRFILAIRADYCGLVTLVVLATATSMAMPLVQLVRALQRWYQTHSFFTDGPRPKGLLSTISKRLGPVPFWL